MSDFVIHKPHWFGKDTISNPLHAINRLKVAIKNLIRITLVDDIRNDYVINQYKKLIYHFQVPSWYIQHDIIIEYLQLAIISMNAGLRRPAAYYLQEAAKKIQCHIKLLMVMKARLQKKDEESNLGVLHLLPQDIKHKIADLI